MALTVRLAGMRGITGSETTLARFLFGLLTVAILHYSGVAKVRLRRVPLLATRGITGGIAILLYFAAISAVRGPGSTPLTNAVFLGNSYFVYIPLLGALLIHERLRISTVAMVIIALGGLYLVVGPDLHRIRMGDVYGLSAGIMSAVAMVVIRELRKTEPWISVFFSLCIFGTLVALGGMALEGGVWPDDVGWLLLLVMGISSAAGQLLMTYALKYTGAGEAGVIQMTTVIYSALAGVLWFGDLFNFRILMGAGLVMAGAAYISMYGGSATSEP